jgi:hypothetical protein
VNGFSSALVDWSAASIPFRYNCFGFAVGVREWWQPPDIRDGVLMNPMDHWRKDIPQDVTLEAYVEAAIAEGFFVCDGYEWEDGFDKILLYYREIGEENLFTHAALQKEPNKWCSKLGVNSDIEHPRDAFDNLIFYGNGRVYMRKPRPA